MREAVEDGVEGFIVPRRDPLAAARALEKLVKDPALRERMGGAGRDRALAQFNLDLQAEQFADLYSSLLSAGRQDPTTTTPWKPDG